MILLDVIRLMVREMADRIADWIMVAARSRVARAHLLQLRDQVINLCQKVFSAGVRVFGEDCAAVRDQIRLTGPACPAAYVAIGQPGKSPQRITTTRMLQVGQQVVKAEGKAERDVHVAVQHIADL